MARPHLPYLFFNLMCEAIGTAATSYLVCEPRVIVKMIVEMQMECRLAGETEIPGENWPQGHFCPSQNPTWPDPGLNPGRRGGKPATNRLNYGAASPFLSYFQVCACFITMFINSFWRTQHSTCLPPLTWRRKQIQFPKRCVLLFVFFRIPDDGQSPKIQ
jgi:hypothetical protein